MPMFKPILLLASLAACGGGADAAPVADVPASRAAEEAVVVASRPAEPVARATTSSRAEERVVPRETKPVPVVREADTAPAPKPAEPVAEVTVPFDAETAKRSVFAAMPGFRIDRVEPAWSRQGTVYYVHGTFEGRRRLLMVPPEGAIEDRALADGAAGSVDDDDA